MTRLPELYGIADASFGDPVEIATQLFSAGVRLVQVRNKASSSRVLLEQATRIVDDAPEDALVVVNDRADIARLSGASGVHLGQDDLPAASVRQMVGDGMMVGLSTHDEHQAQAAVAEPLDYMAVGPIFQTSTKQDPSAEVGVERLGRICRSVELPVVAIGGINLSNLSEVVGAGVASVAVISDLIGNGDIRTRAEEFLAKLNTLGFENV